MPKADSFPKGCQKEVPALNIAPRKTKWSFLMIPFLMSSAQSTNSSVLKLVKLVLCCGHSVQEYPATNFRAPKSIMKPNLGHSTQLGPVSLTTCNRKYRRKRPRTGCCTFTGHGRIAPSAILPPDLAHGSHHRLHVAQNFIGCLVCFVGVRSQHPPRQQVDTSRASSRAECATMCQSAEFHTRHQQSQACRAVAGSYPRTGQSRIPGEQ